MILITGGGGFIGLNTALDLVGRGQEVLLVRRSPFKIPAFLTRYVDKQLKVASGDIGEFSFLCRLIRDYKIDSIIHLATMSEGKGSLHQVLKVNLGGTADVLEAANIFGMRRVTFCSSVAVYQVIKEAQILEEDLDLPVASPDYTTATKKAGEQICQLYAKEYGLSIPIIRPTDVWGPLYWSGRQPVQKIVESTAAGKPADLPDICGKTRRNRVYVRDCARAISLIHLAPSLKHDTYNISASEPSSLNDFAQIIRELIPEAQIKLRQTRSEKDIDQPPVSIKRIKEDVGFTPEYDLKRAVNAYIEWVREQKYS